MSDADEHTSAAEERQVDVVLIKKVECLSCTHLTGKLGTETYPCRDERHCPAATYEIAIGVDLLATSNALAKAWDANDLNTVTKIMNTLADTHPAVREKVMNLAKAPRGT